jgi:RNA-binding protein PNO1
MVVVQAEPSTSAKATKKTRRGKHKKAARIAPDADQEMQQGGSAEGQTTTTSSLQLGQRGEDDDLMIDDNPSVVAQPASAPVFAPLDPSTDRTTLKSETRRIPMPPHRMTPLKKDWVNIFGPLTEILGLQVRMNVQRRSVEIRVSCICSCCGHALRPYFLSL